jgi:hypothetical protein
LLAGRLGALHTPAVTGNFPVTVSVSDTESPAQTGTGRLILVIDPPASQNTATPAVTRASITPSSH